MNASFPFDDLEHNPPESAEEARKRVMSDIIDSLKGAMKKIGHENAYVNGEDPRGGLTLDGEDEYFKALARQNGDVRARTDLYPVGWSHPKRWFWLRPEGNK